MHPSNFWSNAVESGFGPFPKIALLWLAVAIAPASAQINGANGADGINGDPATDGGEGQDGLAGFSFDGLFIRGGRGGNGGWGGNGVDQDNDGNAAGGDGGAGGRGRDMKETLTFDESAGGGRLDTIVVGGDGGDGGRAGLSVGNAAPAQGGVGGDGGNASIDVVVASSVLNPLFRATGGRGGDSSGSFGGDGGSATANALVNVPSNADNDSADISLQADGGDGGDGLLGGGNGGDATLIDAISGGSPNLFRAEQQATGGRGGRNNFNEFISRGGDALSSFRSADANQIGTDVAFRITASAGDGGNATASGDITDSGSVELNVVAFGGSVFPTRDSPTVTGGQAIIPNARAVSIGGNAAVTALAFGGSVDTESFSGGINQGQSVSLNNVANGNAATRLDLRQDAIGGVGNGPLGIGGDASSVLDRTFAIPTVNATTLAVGFNSTSTTQITNQSGDVRTDATATTNQGGTAIADSVAIAVTNDTNATANAAVTQVSTSALGSPDAIGMINVASSEAVHETSGTASANTTVDIRTSGSGDLSTIAEGHSRATVAGSGDATATTTVVGAIGGGNVTGTAYAESQSFARSNLSLTASDGLNAIRTRIDGADGQDIQIEELAGGRGGLGFESTTTIRGGGGGSARSGGVTGDGGDAGVTLSHSSANTGGGSAFYIVDVTGGQGGSHTGGVAESVDGGRGGDALTDIEFTNVGAMGARVVAETRGGAGGRASLGVGGGGGNATGRIHLQSAVEADLFSENTVIAGNGSLSSGSTRGVDGDAIGSAIAESNGGLAIAIDRVVAGSPGISRVDGGNARSEAIARTQAADSLAVSIATTTIDDSQSGLGMPTDDQSIAVAQSDNTYTGTKVGGRSLAIAGGSGDRFNANAVARTGNDIHRQVQIRSEVRGRGNLTETVSQVRIGGIVTTIDDASTIRNAAHMVVDPDEILPMNTRFDSDAPTDFTEFLSVYDSAGTSDTNNIIAAGTYRSQYGDSDTLDSMSRKVEMDFDLAFDPTPNDLVLGFYDPSISNTIERLTLGIDIEGLASTQYVFDDSVELFDFFNFGTISLGKLGDLQRVDGTISLDFVTSQPGQFIGVNYVLGSGVVAVPEPTTTTVLVGTSLMVLVRRRRRSMALMP